MAMSSTGAGGARAEINMTPLIDVLLVLLIIFMTIAPTVSYGLGAKVPQTPEVNATVSPDVPIIITVQADGPVRLNQELVPLDDLASRLTDLFKKSPGQPVFVRGGKGLEFAQVTQVIDIAKGAGLERVALMTE